MKRKSWSRQLAKKSRKAQGPIATVAFYGPTNRHASKVAVGIAKDPGTKVDELRRWFERNVDVRVDPMIGEEVKEFLRSNGVKRVVVAEGIIGCPHEEGKDYPEGEECPECPFWQGKDRFEHAVPKDTD